MKQKKAKSVGRPAGSKAGDIPTVRARTVELNVEKMACGICKQVGWMKVASTHEPINGLKVSYLHCRFCQSRTRLERRVEEADIG